MSESNANVLIVEDNPGDARLTMEMLRDAPGLTLRTAASLAECLAILDEGAIDVVILDLGLPDSQGMDTVRSVVDAFPAVAVVAVTGLDDEWAGTEALRIGAQAYLAKGSAAANIGRRSVRYAFERKRAEADLIRSELKWHNVLRHTPQIGIGLDPEGRVVFANAHFLRLTGWDEHEVLGKDWCDLCLPEDRRDEVRGVFATIMANRDGQDYTSYENPILTRSGETRDVAWSNVLTRAPDGTVVEVTCLGGDLTERLRAQRELEVSETRFRSLFETMAAGCCVDVAVYVDGRAVDYRILDVNPAYERIMGIPRERAVTALASEGYGLGGAPFLEIFARVAETGESAAFEAYFPPARKHLSITVGCPAPGMFSTVFTDVTAAKQAEARIADQLNELLQWQDVTIGREERIMDLKREVNALSERLGLPRPYPGPSSREPDRKDSGRRRSCGSATGCSPARGATTWDSSRTDAPRGEQRYRKPNHRL